MPQVRRSSSLPEQLPTVDERNKWAEQALAARFDALNQQFTQAEQLLKSLKPPHDVWVYYGEHGEEGFRSCQSLGLAKHCNKWRICHAFENEDEGRSDQIPIVECPVEVRIESAKYVRQLREAIVKAKEEYVPKVDEAIKELADACNALAGGKEAR